MADPKSKTFRTLLRNFCGEFHLAFPDVDIRIVDFTSQPPDRDGVHRFYQPTTQHNAFIGYSDIEVSPRDSSDEGQRSNDMLSFEVTMGVTLVLPVNRPTGVPGQSPDVGRFYDHAGDVSKWGEKRPILYTILENIALPGQQQESLQSKAIFVADGFQIVPFGDPDPELNTAYQAVEILFVASPVFVADGWDAEQPIGAPLQEFYLNGVRQPMTPLGRLGG